MSSQTQVFPAKTRKTAPGIYTDSTNVGALAGSYIRHQLSVSPDGKCLHIRCSTFRRSPATHVNAYFSHSHFDSRPWRVLNEAYSSLPRIELQSLSFIMFEFHYALIMLPLDGTEVMKRNNFENGRCNSLDSNREPPEHKPTALSLD
jgi:hypothetical protein